MRCTMRLRTRWLYAILKVEIPLLGVRRTPIVFPGVATTIGLYNTWTGGGVVCFRRVLVGKSMIPRGHV